MLCFVSFIFFSFLSLLGAQTPGSTPGPWGGVGGVGWVCIRKSQRPVKSQQPVPALWEVRSTGARALGGGEPVGQARAGLSGWSFLALEAPRASRTLLDCESKYRPKNFTFSLRVRGNARWGVGAAAGAVGARGGGGVWVNPGAHPLQWRWPAPPLGRRPTAGEGGLCVFFVRSRWRDRRPQGKVSK